MKRIFTMVAAILTVAMLQAMPVRKGWKLLCTSPSHDTERLFQGLLYKDGELFQCFDGGMVNVLDARDFSFKRSFQLPYPGHYSTVEWLDHKRFATTDYDCNLYITDLSDEGHMTCDTIHMSALNPTFFTKMAALAYDKSRHLLYVSGYAPDKNFRRDVVTAVLDLSPYLSGTSRDLPLLDVWSVPSYHIQDGCFYKGLIWHLVDKSVGQTGKPWDCLAVYALDPATKAVKARLEVPLKSFEEAQALSVFDDKVILSDVADRTHCRYYQLDLDFSGKGQSEEQLLSPSNPERNALCSVYGLYDFTSERLDQPAPKGYKPFYMIHYGRPGAASLSDASDYELLHRVFTSVPDAELTPLGRVLAARYESVYPELKGRGGELSDTGRRELSLLGRRYAKAFPQLFRKGSTVVAECLDEPSCTESASTFCRTFADAGCTVSIGNGRTSTDSLFCRPCSSSVCDASVDSLIRSHVDVEAICKLLFRKGSSVLTVTDAAVFVRTLWKLACSMPLTQRPDVAFTFAFSYKDLVALKGVEDDGYRSACQKENSEAMEASHRLLNRMLQIAREDIRGDGKISARLFFGPALPLLPLLRQLVPDGQKDRLSSSDIPVAANVRLVFYRRGNDILYKVQLNESDVTEYLKLND